MSIVDLEIVFHGKATESGTIDARLLAQSLNGCSAIFSRSNEIANGEMSSASVLVCSEFKRGSFVVNIQLVQNLAEAASQLITSHPFIDAEGVASIIGFMVKDQVKDSLIDLYKWIKGKRPDSVTPSENDVTIRSGDNQKVVSNVVYNFYGDSAIRQGLAQMTEPIRSADLEKISIYESGEEKLSIDKKEADYFMDDEVPFLSAEEDAKSGERVTILTVSKLSFIEKNTWTFYERGAVVRAIIDDHDFWKNIHDRSLTFGEGDRLKVKLLWSIEKKHKIIQKNTIEKVYEIYPRYKQLRLDENAERA